MMDESFKKLSREEINKVQLEKLKQTVKYVYDSCSYYREKMNSINVKPEDIDTLEDIEKLPFTTKEDFRNNYPYGMFAVPLKDILRIHASSGTSGKPTVVGYTKNDLEVWSECVARIAWMGGAEENDIAQICFGYGMFTGALGLHYGLEKLGVTVVPTSVGNSEKQIMYMKDFKTTVIIATPSYALRLAEVAKEIGVDIEKDLCVKKLILGSELMTAAIKAELHKLWGHDVKITSNYGMSELMGPGVSGQCLSSGNSMHINEDYFIAEIIDPNTLKKVKDGEIGELVITCLSKEALPLLRYRTRDITSLDYSPCECGVPFCKMTNLQGRSDDMIKVRGVNVFPGQIEDAILGFEGIGPHYEIVIEREGFSDKLTIRLELLQETDDFKELIRMNSKIKDRIKSILGIDIIVKLESPQTLRRFEGKAKRIVDLRNVNKEV